MAKTQMVINYVPGEECRVAVLRDGRLDELLAEHTDAVSHVGNIYVGKVMNVEAGIQAAFVDFGLESNGFLHISDLHPRYFPGEDEETMERVGKKTPRRERPPIQECLRRGQEIAVQVLKEGVGSKGPTLTSYLSIPGRFLVMMPQMDRVGVSRKVEDDEQRTKMREILDQLELPEGFGFIVRTAGMDRTKAELKRDLAYLLRLWKDMERRWKASNKPRLLYTESDLLVRVLRDVLVADIEEVVVDDESALRRAARFMKIVSPRTSTRLVHYAGKVPVFHAMGIEEQIRTVAAREVPLPSGGRLVIDETEALVAIDVNSGKMRDARDSETNAYRTNMEAADEICRQLRLRDLGGIVINDLIDMRSHKHRRELEARFRENLKRDRARSTVAPISDFGVLELTRQRMRGSHESVHFATCPLCHGRGLLQKPDSVAADALRELAALLNHDGVQRVEMAVHPRVAGELLSTRRTTLSRLERRTGKPVAVRVSDAIAMDRVTFYAYDAQGADIDVTRITFTPRSDDVFRVVEQPESKDEAWALDADAERRGALEQAAPSEEPEIEVEAHPIELEGPDVRPEELTAPGELLGTGGRRRRRRRRGRGSGESGAPSADGGRTRAPEPAPDANGDARADVPVQAGEPGAPAGEGTDDNGQGRRRRRRRRRGGRGRSGAEGAGVNEAHGGGSVRESGGSPDDVPARDQDGYGPSGDRGEPMDGPSGGTLEQPEGSERDGDFAGEDTNGGVPDGEGAEGQPGTGEEDGTGSHAAGPGEPGQGGGRRRRRRRRRGRGGGQGGGGGDGAPHAAPAPAPGPGHAHGQGGRQPARPQGGRGPANGGRGGGRDGQRERTGGQDQHSGRADNGGRRPDRAPAPPPLAEPKPAQPPVRRLYASHRKLRPTERGSPPRDE